MPQIDPHKEAAGARLTSHRYGKSRVRLMRVTRHESHHDLHDWTVEVLLTGDFAEVFTEGDNSRVLATDTMKNTVYFLARKSTSVTPELFAMELIEFLLSRNPQVSSAEVTVESHLWKRLTIEGQSHPTAFMKGSDERQTTTVARAQGGAFLVQSGFTEMSVLKTAQSSFKGFLRDELTTLPETDDRLLGTAVTAQWTYASGSLTTDEEFHRARHTVRESMIGTFARHESLSVQQTLFAMGEAAFRAHPSLTRIFLRMPNRHNLLVDFGRFGLENPNHIFVPTEEPHGTIEATLERADAS